MFTKDSDKRVDIIDAILVILAAITMPIGIGMNNIISFASKLYSIVLILLIIKQFFSNGKITINRNKSTFVTLALYFVIHTFVCVLLFALGKYSYDSLFDLLMCPVFLIGSFSLCITLFKSIKILMPFCSVFCVSTILISLLFNNDVLDGSSAVGYSYRMCGTFANPNGFANLVILGFYLSLLMVGVFFNARKKVLHGIASIFLASVFIYLIIESGSRGAAIGLVVGIVCLFVRLLKVTKRKGSIVFLSLIFVIVLYYLVRNDLNMVLMRLSLSGNASFSNNERILIWKSFLKNIDKYFLLGTDRNTFLSFNVQSSHSTPHNFYLAVFVRFGVLGIIFYLSYILGVFKIFTKSHDRSFFPNVLFCLFLANVVASFFIDSMNIRSFWVSIMMYYLSANKVEDGSFINENSVNPIFNR